jgi:PLP dependent protein
MELVEKAAACEHLRVNGLMTMAPFVDDQNIIRAAFRDLRLLKEKIAVQYQGHPRVQMTTLSMGMSHDYEIAVEEGATMVRIGTAIFKE